jgi:hypothetical protein
MKFVAIILFDETNWQDQKPFHVLEGEIVQEWE